MRERARPLPRISPTVAARCRGAAVVEIMLSITFLFLFPIAMTAFAKGLAAIGRAHRAARHLAWAQARHDDDGSQPAAPTVDDLKTTHFGGKGGDVTATAEADSISTPFSNAVDSFSLFDLGSFGRGVLSFLGGKIDLTKATVAQTLDAARFLTGGEAKAVHKVSLDPRREADVADPEGWWDPYKELKDQITPK